MHLPYGTSPHLTTTLTASAPHFVNEKSKTWRVESIGPTLAQSGDSNWNYVIPGPQDPSPSKDRMVSSGLGWTQVGLAADSGRQGGGQRHSPGRAAWLCARQAGTGPVVLA